MREKRRGKGWLPVLFIAFPCVVGMVGMAGHGVSAALWLQNPLAILLLTLACVPMSRLNGTWNDEAIVLAAAGLLGLTFLGPEAEGVHRWLRLPFATLNMAAIVLPLTIVALNRLMAKKKGAFSVGGIVAIALLLALQPDASQLLAFSLPMLVSLYTASVSKPAKAGVFAVLLGLNVRSWVCLDDLQPVPYSEGILTMLRDLSPALSILGIVALCGVPAGLLGSWTGKDRKSGPGVALYEALMIVSAWIGNFPVPFMGYGLSPILGFYLVLMRFQSEAPEKA